jgi:uncharacterized membrane-anchored protein YhcB (DUF1043 family)
LNKLWLWLATRQATAWVAAILLAVIALGVGYVQQLRVEAAHCRGRESVQAQLDDLTDKVVKGIHRETKDAVEQIEDLADDGCLDRVVPDGLRDE